QLFPLENPLGKAVRVDSDYYIVVGVTRDRSPTAGIGGSMAAQEFNNDVYIPITTLWSRVGDQVYTRRSGSREGQIVELNQITLRIGGGSPETVRQTAEVVRFSLASTHPFKDYAVVVPRELLDQAESTRYMFIMFMGSIAAISLMVGGIGIMNIMLATVTERTREIGVRRALGATRATIMQQFLVETIVLSVMGGVTGIAGGLACKPVLNGIRDLITMRFPQAVRDLPEVFHTVQPIVVPESIPLAFVISIVIGVTFGMYPAARAAWMNPIEALRHE
ncbi:MAG: FtsX-like permease family protein, partial [Planctomycetales bacterium]